MKAKIIIGANLGDEGKGTVVANYTKQAKGSVLNVLTNGGSQRAHSILTEDGSFTFQHFGSGTYHGADNYFSKFFILNPMQFVKEYDELQKRGIDLKNKIYRHPDCMWSTPYDMMSNQIIEALRSTNKHGSCGMGIWETILRYKSTVCVSFSDFISMTFEQKKSYLGDVKKYFEKRMNCEIPDVWKSVWNSESLLLNFISDCEIFNNLTTILLIPNGYDNIFFENGQGLMLNDTGLDTPGTTPSKTNSEYAISLINDFGIDYNDVCVHYVTRPYMTRHGKGYLDKECDRKYISQNIEEDRTNHFNVHQDDFRYGYLDLHSLKERINSDNRMNLKSVLEITHCDEMDRETEFKKVFNNINMIDSPYI